MIHTDRFGQRFITQKDYPNLYAEIQEYCKYAIHRSCCIDEALDWNLVINAPLMYVNDINYILSSNGYKVWKENR